MTSLIVEKNGKIYGLWVEENLNVKPGWKAWVDGSPVKILEVRR